MTCSRLGAALMALALILLLPAAALAQTIDTSTVTGIVASALSLTPWGIYVPLAVTAASLLDAVLPHASATTPKWLAVPRALISTLAINMGRASNAQGVDLGAALSAVGGAVGGGIGKALTSPITGIVAAQVEKALAAQQAAALAPAPMPETTPPAEPAAAPVPAPAQ